jgi:hypothetical protein
MMTVTISFYSKVVATLLLASASGTLTLIGTPFPFVFYSVHGFQQAATLCSAVVVSLLTVRTFVHPLSSLGKV